MNKKKIITPLFFAAAFLLASCSTDTIVARPDWQNDPIITDATGSLKDNKMKSIYDAIKKLGDTNANVLNQVLYEIAKTNIGEYEALEIYSKDDAITTKKEDLKAFVANHKCYQPKDNIGYKKEGDKSVATTLDEDQLLKISHELIKLQYEQLMLEIYNKLWDEIKGSEFVTDNLFYEERFIMNLRKNLYDIPSLEEIGEVHNAVRIENKPKEETSSAMRTHLDKYLTFTKEISGKSVKLYNDYISRKILPDLYRNYLIQNYVNDQRYPNLGRSYARKVNMITIPAASSSTARRNVRNMLNEFAKRSLNLDEVGYKYNFDFSILEQALIGNVGLGTKETSEPVSLLEAGSFERMKDSTGNVDLIWPFSSRGESSGIQTTYVYKGTKLGDLVEKYLKIFNVTYDAGKKAFVSTQKKITTEVTTAYNDLTNSGAYSIDHGLTLKERELLLTSYVKSGWYLKSNGLSDLNATIKDRLFNISVANIIDDTSHPFETTDYVKYYDTYDTTTKATTKKAFITSSSHQSSQGEYERVILGEDSANFSIIQVEEAVSTSKLSTDENTKAYRYKYADAEDPTVGCIEQNKRVHQVVKNVATNGDTYKKNANQYYLLISNIVFSDQSVYDYFKSQYPDLFK